MDNEFINKFLENLKEEQLDEEFIQSIEALIRKNDLTEDKLINLIEGVIDG